MTTSNLSRLNDKHLAAGEWEARVALAACYRLVALYGMDDIVYTHISARVPGTSTLR